MLTGSNTWYLIVRYLHGDNDPSVQKKLYKWISESNENKAILEQLVDLKQMVELYIAKSKVSKEEAQDFWKKSVSEYLEKYKSK
jgi:hypothetical protein